MTRPEKSQRKWNSNSGCSALEAVTLTTRPTRWLAGNKQEEEEEEDEERISNLWVGAVGPHAPCVGPCVAHPKSFVILRWGHHRHCLPIREGKHLLQIRRMASVTLRAHVMWWHLSLITKNGTCRSNVYVTCRKTTCLSEASIACHKVSTCLKCQSLGRICSHQFDY